MVNTTYEQINESIKKIIADQNIKYEDLGYTEEQINNFSWFDMAVIKKLQGSNVQNKGSVHSKQSSILLTGEIRNIFPCVKRNEFAGEIIGKNIIIKIDLRLMSNNYAYLVDSSVNLKDVENKVINSFVTTNETTGDRIELGCKTLDDINYVNMYENLSVGDLIFIIKLKSKLEYIIFAIKESDEEKYFSNICSNIDVVTFFDKISRVSESNKGDITYIEPDKYSYKRIVGGKNKIYFGAPGTGKSKIVNDKYYNGYAKRVTFHPEYTYNDFVGYIKPIVDGEFLSYKFQPGVFTQILTEALLDPSNMYTLIIEELNRANTSAVFGDLFQLLDRNSDGSSEYRINNFDIYKYIKDCMHDNYIYKDGSIGLPSNLNIIATMNTADQNVFAMDTAFKRRWEFEYIPINFEENHPFKDDEIVNLNITWQNFVDVINEFMMSKENEDLMISEDKQIGPYFIKKDELKDSNKFGYKILLYLWDDVFKMDRERIFNNSIRTFSKLIEIFSTENAIDVFNDDLKSKFSIQLAVS